MRRAQLSAQEQKDIVAAFANPAQAQASGVRLAGQKFFVLQANDRSIYGKKQVCSPDQIEVLFRVRYADRMTLRRMGVCS